MQAFVPPVFAAAAAVPIGWPQPVGSTSHSLRHTAQDAGIDTGGSGPLRMTLSVEMRELLQLEPDADDTQAGSSTAPERPVFAPSVRTARALASADVHGPRDAPVDLGQRAAGLQFLREFERNFPRRLSMGYSPWGFRYESLVAGNPNFRNADDMARTVPCASSLHPSPNGYYAVYPQGLGLDAGVRSVRIDGRVATVAHGENQHLVRWRSDGDTQWTSTAVYTDDVIEAEKVRMWQRIRASAAVLMKQVRQQQKWMRWR